MKITTISASVRYSNGSRGKAFTTIELSAEADVAANEDWKAAQAKLYQELGQQLKSLWPAKSNDNTTGQASHHCAEHDTPFERFERDGRIWYAHRQGGGWHNEGQIANAWGLCLRSGPSTYR